MERIYREIVSEIKRLYKAADGESVPLHRPVFIGKEKKYLEECVDTTFVSSVGPFVDRFEKEMADYTGAKRAVACVNGTAALHLALELAGVKPGELVLTQAVTFVATCNAISYTQASPVFIDVDSTSLSLSPDGLREWLEKNARIDKGGCFEKSSGRKIGAVVVMHTFGHPALLDELLDVCKQWSLPLIEDAAESIGSLYKGRHTGTYGLIGTLSFNGNKTITTGGGGMLLFNDEELASKAKHLSTQAKLPHPWEFRHDRTAYNYRMPNINAALGCAQLEQIERYVADKRRTAVCYEHFFSGLTDKIRFLVEPPHCRSNYWLNAIIMPDKKSRDEFLEYTNKNGVMTRPVWELMTDLPMWRNSQNDGLVNSLWLRDRIVNIPSGVRL